MKKAACLVLCFALSACTHAEKEAEDKNFKSVRPPLPVSGTSDVGFGGIVGGIAIAFDLAQKKGTKREPSISGTCQLIDEKRSRPCDETYLEIEMPPANEKSVVWLDSKGFFDFVVRPGQKLLITAVSDRYLKRSKTIEVSQAGRISLTIDIRRKAEGSP